MDHRGEILQPLVIDEADALQNGWDDPVRGRIRWRTLFSQGLTQTAGMTCGVTELGPGGSRRWISPTAIGPARRIL